MHKNAERIKRFYSAFQKRDAAGMASCYQITGKLLGGTSFLQGKVRAKAAKSLDDYLA